MSETMEQTEEVEDKKQQKSRRPASSVYLHKRIKQAESHGERLY